MDKLTHFKFSCLTALFFVSFGAFCQVKIGSNPTAIGPNSNLEVEAASGNKTVIQKNNGNVGVGTATPGNKLEINEGNAGNSGLRFTQMNDVTPPATNGVAPLGVNTAGDVVVINSSVGVQFSLVPFSGINGSNVAGGEVCYDKICVRSVASGSAIPSTPDGIDLQVRSNTGAALLNSGVGGYQLATSGVNLGNTWIGTLNTTYTNGTYALSNGQRAYFFGAALPGEYIFSHITLADASYYRVTQNVINGTPGMTQLILEKVK